jgi:hypothetical protein
MYLFLMSCFIQSERIGHERVTPFFFFCQKLGERDQNVVNDIGDDHLKSLKLKGTQVPQSC